MRRFWGHLMAFLLLTAVVYMAFLLLLILVRPNGHPLLPDTGDYYKEFGKNTWAGHREFDPRTAYDVVIIGSSHAYRGYDPHIFQEHGHRAFNLGSTAQTPLNTYFLIRDLLDSSNAPLLILDAYEGMMASSGLESISDLALNQAHIKPVLGMAWALRDIRAINVVAYGLVYQHLGTASPAPDYKGLGFSSRTDSTATPAPPPKGPASLSPQQRHYMAKIVELCREKGIRLVVASHYGRRNKRGTFHVPLATFVDSMLRGTDIPYLDYNSVAGIGDHDWFCDANHLNYTGARIFTEQLVDTLETLGYLPRKPISSRP